MKNALLENLDATAIPHVVTVSAKSSVIIFMVLVRTDVTVVTEGVIVNKVILSFTDVKK